MNLAELQSRMASAIMSPLTGSDSLAPLIEIADRGCIMMNTLRDKLTLNIRVATPV